MPPKRFISKSELDHFRQEAAQSSKTRGRGKTTAEAKGESTVKTDEDPAANGEADTKDEPAKPDTKRKRAKAAPKKEPSPDDPDAEPAKPAKKARASKSNPKPDPFHADTLAKHPPRIGTTTQIPMKHIIGAHTSTSGGPEYALVNASELGANALAMFLKNQRRWESKGFEEASVECWKRMMKSRDDGGE